MKRSLTLLATVAMAAGMALAQPAADHSNNRRAMFRERIAQELNLNDAQKAQAKSIFAATRQETAPLRSQLKQDRAALRIAVKTNDRAQIEKLSSEEGRIVGKLMAARSESMAKFYQTLTPEQRAKADQLHSSWMQRRQQHRSAANRG